ncbi:hypothetical protein NDU88_002953 [Pleurodeles waltl]|uniref:Uncharacterized protein n=1 Tax=Pleurodeles waltl TaxID=8319 RepID=A0AAV7L0G9_PLEWA|nr:hypothetical protein NDU88_002953 [Pleurodeles waltl]
MLPGLTLSIGHEEEVTTSPLISEIAGAFNLTTGISLLNGIERSRLLSDLRLEEYEEETSQRALTVMNNPTRPDCKQKNTMAGLQDSRMMKMEKTGKPQQEELQ